MILLTLLYATGKQSSAERPSPISCVVSCFPILRKSPSRKVYLTWTRVKRAECWAFLKRAVLLRLWQVPRLSLSRVAGLRYRRSHPSPVSSRRASCSVLMLSRAARAASRVPRWSAIHSRLASSPMTCYRATRLPRRRCFRRSRSLWPRASRPLPQPLSPTVPWRVRVRAPSASPAASSTRTYSKRSPPPPNVEHDVRYRAEPSRTLLWAMAAPRLHSTRLLLWHWPRLRLMASLLCLLCLIRPPPSRRRVWAALHKLLLSSGLRFSRRYQPLHLRQCTLELWSISAQTMRLSQQPQSPITPPCRLTIAPRRRQAHPHASCASQLGSTRRTRVPYPEAPRRAPFRRRLHPLHSHLHLLKVKLPHPPLPHYQWQHSLLELTLLPSFSPFIILRQARQVSRLNSVHREPLRRRLSHHRECSWAAPSRCLTRALRCRSARASRPRSRRDRAPDLRAAYSITCSPMDRIEPRGRRSCRRHSSFRTLWAPSTLQLHPTQARHV